MPLSRESTVKVLKALGFKNSDCVREGPEVVDLCLG